MDYLLAAIAILGHFAICIYVINRLHATALPHGVMKVIDLAWYATLFGIPAAIVAGLVMGLPVWLVERPNLHVIGWVYAISCWIGAAALIPVWVRHFTDATTTDRLISNCTATIDVVDELGHRPSGSWVTDLAYALPGNQIFELAIPEKTLRLPRLPARLEGLSIAHLSDLHFTGRVTRPFYDLIVDRTNAMDADLVVLSGDIIDKRWCWSWIGDVLGRLESRYGVYFVLGNHDLRVHDEVGLRAALREAGLKDLGGRWDLLMVNEYPVLLAGNELPWFAPAADMRRCPQMHTKGRPFRLGVVHTPDQLPWAKSFDFDLVLAGHTHGGQIQFPVIGPVFSPSNYGVKYAGGTYYEEPTLMHVSRGLCGTRPLRFNCLPELAKLILVGESTPAPQSP